MEPTSQSLCELNIDILYHVSYSLRVNFDPLYMFLFKLLRSMIPALSLPILSALIASNFKPLFT